MSCCGLTMNDSVNRSQSLLKQQKLSIQQRPTALWKNSYSGQQYPTGLSKNRTPGKELCWSHHDSDPL